MTRIQTWAHQHLWASRTLLVIGHFALAFLAMESGLRLFLAGLELSAAWLWACSLAFFILLNYYPAKTDRQKWAKPAFIRRRFAFDQGLICCGFLLTALTFNRSAQLSIGTWPAQFSVVPIAIKEVSPAAKAIYQITHPFAGEDSPAKWRKSIREQIKSRLSQMSPQEKKNQVLWFVLIALLSAVLSVLLAALACNISCSGAEALAILVATAGLLGIFFLVNFLVRLVLPEEQKKKSWGTALLLFLGGNLLWLLITFLS